MNFQDAVKLCFQKYVDFNGRAARPEFWWFFLFCLLASIVLGLISETLSTIFSLATLLPTLAVGARRLHDINKTGWLQLAWYIGIIVGAVIMAGALASGKYAFAGLGALVTIATIAYMIYLAVKVGDIGDNNYGPPPAN
ncbi:MAG: DUF805 domain-containing protein [Methylotenera sp.]|jgi:uncharacterized membrane protein YhaH (DUF805 family)